MPDLVTLANIKARIKDDLDLNDENFISDTSSNPELLRLINSAISDAEAVILREYEDYFLTMSPIQLVSGTHSYDLPSDIYAQKIRGIIYSDATTGSGSSTDIDSTTDGKKYEIRPIRNFYETMDLNSTEEYRYLITNDSTNGVQLRLYPTPAESGYRVFLWYIRNAKQLSATTDTCDIPEWINFIYAHVAHAVAEKEMSSVKIANAARKLLYLKNEMIDTLKDRKLDRFSNEIVPDLSFYYDFDYDPFSSQTYS